MTLSADERKGEEAARYESKKSYVSLSLSFGKEVKQRVKFYKPRNFPSPFIVGLEVKEEEEQDEITTLTLLITPPSYRR